MFKCVITRVCNEELNLNTVSIEDHISERPDRSIIIEMFYLNSTASIGIPVRSLL